MQQRGADGTSGEVSAEVVVDHGPHAGPGRMTALRLVWDPADPCAVLLRLTAHPDHPALARGEWVVLREVLHEGLTSPAGAGTVHVHPDELRDRVWFELERSGPAVCLSVPRAVVTDFLAATELAVPTGAEPVGQALERLLRDVLYSS